MRLELQLSTAERMQCNSTREGQHLDFARPRMQLPPQTQKKTPDLVFGLDNESFRYYLKADSTDKRSQTFFGK